MTRTVQLLRHDAYNCTTSAWRVQLYNYGWNQACWWPIRFENFDIVVISFVIASIQCTNKFCFLIICNSLHSYLTVILRGRAGYELIYITNEAVSRVGYYQLISSKSEKNNCFSKFSSNSLAFFGWNLLKSWHFLYRRRRENIFSDLQNFSTRNSPSVFPYLVKLNDNGSFISWV